MLAILKQDVSFVTIDGVALTIPAETIFVMDLKLGIGFIHDYHIDLDQSEYELFN